MLGAVADRPCRAEACASGSEPPLPRLDEDSNELLETLDWPVLGRLSALLLLLDEEEDVVVVVVVVLLLPVVVPVRATDPCAEYIDGDEEVVLDDEVNECELRLCAEAALDNRVDWRDPLLSARAPSCGCAV
jgi:hypothetical protein